MPDIYINHSALSTSTQDLEQKQQQMVNALQEFIAQVSPHLANTEGNIKDAWNQVQTQVNSTTSRAHDAMARAVSTLDEMHTMHKTADANGAAILGA